MGNTQGVKASNRPRPKKVSRVMPMLSVARDLAMRSVSDRATGAPAPPGAGPAPAAGRSKSTVLVMGG